MLTTVSKHYDEKPIEYYILEYWKLKGLNSLIVLQSDMATMPQASLFQYKWVHKLTMNIITALMKGHKQAHTYHWPVVLEHSPYNLHHTYENHLVPL